MSDWTTATTKGTAFIALDKNVWARVDLIESFTVAGEQPFNGEDGGVDVFMRSGRWHHFSGTHAEFVVVLQAASGVGGEGA